MDTPAIGCAQGAKSDVVWFMGRRKETGCHMPLRIGPTTYIVEFVDEPKLDTEITDGLIDLREATIKIARGLPRERQTITLWHEIIHGIECDRQMSFTEREVDSLARGIVAVLIDNPDWQQRLVPGLKGDQA